MIHHKGIDVSFDTPFLTVIRHIPIVARESTMSICSLEVQIFISFRLLGQIPRYIGNSQLQYIGLMRVHI